jgi:protein-tyrosine phosphatase
MKRASHPFPLAITRASLAEADVVVALVHDVARWMASRGNNQWQSYLTPGGERYIRNRVGSTNGAEVYVAWRPEDADPIGAFSLEWEDAANWDVRGTDGRGGYIHMLCVAPRATGQCIGAAMLRFAEQRIAAGGRSLARLDCGDNNSRLCSYYERNGYTAVGTKQRGHVARLYEKSL